MEKIENNVLRILMLIFGALSLVIGLYYAFFPAGYGAWIMLFEIVVGLGMIVIAI